MKKIYRVHFRDKDSKEHVVSYFGDSKDDVKKLFYSIKRKGDVLLNIERTF